MTRRAGPIAWSYHRPGCITCKRTQGFLATNRIEVEATTDARKARIEGNAAFKVLEGIDDLYATRGRKVVHLDMRTKPSREEIAALLIGPSGNLRAPTLRTGRTLLVGFDEALYRRHLLSS